MVSLDEVLGEEQKKGEIIMSYESVIVEVAKIKEQRGSIYRVEPRDIVPIEFLESIIVLKAYRGYYGNNTEKKIDEYRDIINYCAFVIDRLQKNTVKNVGAKTECLKGYFDPNDACRSCRDESPDLYM